MTPKEKLNRIFKKALVEKIKEKYKDTKGIRAALIRGHSDEDLYSMSRKDLEQILAPSIHITPTPPTETTNKLLQKFYTEVYQMPESKSYKKTKNKKTR